MAWAFGRQIPDTSLIRFVSRRFRWSAHCLDIGSGEGANARELKRREHTVVTMDKDHRTGADYVQDVQESEFWPESFHLVYDINTLCHVEHPPWEKIRGWLKPKGVFFSICPTALAPKYIENGKDYTRRVDEVELRLMLQPFFKTIKIEWRSEPDFKDNQLDSWIVEARR